MLLRVRPNGAPLAAWAGTLLACACLASRAIAQDDLMQELQSVHTVRISGARHLSGSDLRSVMKTRSRSRLPWSERPSLRADFLRSDTASVRALYRHFGFLETSVSWRLLPRRDPDEVDVDFLIDEGPRTLIHGVRLELQRHDLEAPLRKRLYAKAGRPYDPAYLQLDTLVISAVYQDHGYRPHAEASASMDPASGGVDLTYLVHEGPIYRVGDVNASGYRSVPRRLVLRELLLTPGDVYSRDKVKRSQERVYDTGLFDQVQITTLPDSTNTLVEFDLRVREHKPHWVDATIGSGSDERLRFTGTWGSRNLFRRGMQSALDGVLAFYGDGHFQRFHVDYSLIEPWLFGTRTRGGVTPFWEYYDDRANPAVVVHQRFLGVNFDLRRDLNRWTKVTLSQTNSFVEQRVQFIQAVDPATEDSIQQAVTPDYRTHRLTLSFARDTRDNPLLTQHGSVQYVSGQLAGGPLRGASNFGKLEATPAWYSPVRGVLVATRARAGVIRPIGELTTILPDPDPQVASIPLEDRFRTGGVNSVRGFDENSIPSNGGLAVLQGTIELRASLARISKLGSFGFEAFVDAGNVWARPSYIRLDQLGPSTGSTPLGPNEMRWVFGAGPRLETPIGPLRLDVSWNLRPVTGVRGQLEPRTQFAIGPSF